MRQGRHRRQLELRDADEIDDRASRLADLLASLPSGHVEIFGTAADLLFEDVKATWIYGFFAGTVVSGHAFCLLQLAGMIRAGTDAFQPGGETRSLSRLAKLAYAEGVLSGETHALVTQLADRHEDFTDSQGPEPDDRLSRHLAEAERFIDDPPLLAEARLALLACISILRQWRT